MITDHDYSIAAQRILSWADTLAAHTDVTGELTCTYLTPAHRATAQQIAQWMNDCGFDEVRHDAVGNVIGRYKGGVAHGLVATGSHYDTVRNGGRYDGRLGILVPMAVVAAMHARNERLPFDLEVVGFAEEEGVRFGGTFLGSSAYAGQYDPALLALRDGDGVSVSEAMLAAGLDPDVLCASGNAPAEGGPTGLRHYFEIHIEQGPVLLETGRALGVVSAIAGCVRRVLVLEGLAGHAGTVPMALRRDAAAAGAEIVLAVERICRERAGVVGTVGILEVPGGSINVVPGQCRLSLDVRAGKDETRDAALAAIDAEVQAICRRRNIAWTSTELLRAAAVPCSDEGRRLWRKTLQDIGHEPFELSSGAGHDAMLMARVVPVSMLFLRCGNGGISHNPLETVSAADVADTCRATRRFLDVLAADGLAPAG